MSFQEFDSTAELIGFGVIVFILLILTIFLWFFSRRLKVWLVTFVEAREFRAGGAPDRHAQAEFANKLFRFPIFLISTFVLAGLAIVIWQQQALIMPLTFLPQDWPQHKSWFVRYLNWVGPWVLPIVAAGYFFTFLELRPDDYRRRKHDYALALVGVVFVFGLVGLAAVEIQQPGWIPWFFRLPSMGLVLTQNDPIEVRLFIWVTLTLMVAFYFLAFLEHVRPYGNRRRKYDYALALASTLWLWHQLFFGSYKTLVYQPLIALALALGTSSLMRLICKPADNPGSTAKYIHLWIKCYVEITIFAFSALFLPIALPMVLVMRYRSVQWMTNCPIVYLRSFSQENAPKVFNKIISTPSNRFGVLVALVHQTQSASDLRTIKIVPILRGSQFSGSSDDNWKAWVADKIEHASAVIIDYSIETEGVRWEVEHALKNTDPERILVFAQHDSNIEAPAGTHVIKYKDSWIGFGEARTEFEKWVCNRVLG